MTKEENSIESVKETLLPVVPNEDHQLTFDVQTTDSGIPQVNLKEFDEMNKQLDEYLAYAEDYKYKTEDRQDIKKLKAKINKFRTASNKQKNSIRDFMIEPLTEQQSILLEKMDDLAGRLFSGLEREDAARKEKKNKEIISLFESAKRSYDSLASDDSLVVADISDRSWLNQTTTMSSITKDLGSRVRAIHNVKSSPLLPESKSDLRLIVDTLKTHDFDAMESLNHLVDVHKREVQAEEDERLLKQAREEQEKERALQREAEKQSESEEKQKKEPKLPNVSFEVAGSDADRVSRILDSAGITYTKQEQ